MGHGGVLVVAQLELVDRERRTDRIQRVRRHLLVRRVLVRMQVGEKFVACGAHSVLSYNMVSEIRSEHQDIFTQKSTRTRDHRDQLWLYKRY